MPDEAIPEDDISHDAKKNRRNIEDTGGKVAVYVEVNLDKLLEEDLDDPAFD